MKTASRRSDGDSAAGHFPDHPTCPKRSIVFTILPVLIADQHNAVHRQFRRMKRCSVTACDLRCRARSAPPNHPGNLNFTSGPHELLLIDGTSTPPAPSTISQSLIQTAGHTDAPEVNLNPRPPRRQVRETGGTICTPSSAFGSVPIPASRSPSRVRASSVSGLDRFPVNGIGCAHSIRRERLFCNAASVPVMKKWCLMRASRPTR